MLKRHFHYSPAFSALLLVFFVIVTSFACTFSVDGDNSQPKPGEGIIGYEVFFTDPCGLNSETLKGGPDKHVADAIRDAHTSVDIAAQYLDLWSIRDALIDVHHRGVTVRMITESNYLDERETQDLIEVGIPVLGDRREGLMHNKYIVIDREDVWTGSMNFSVNGAYRNENNLIHIHSIDIAQNYIVEFEEMFQDDQFGPGSPENTPNPIIELDGAIFEIYFSPEDGILNRIIELVQSAEESIYIMAFSFTSDELADAIIEQAQDGVTVAGVFDESQYYSNNGGEFDRFFSKNLDVRLDGNPKSMHHKVIIVDEKIVITGSYNFSNNAETRNDENTLVIHDPGMASLFLEEFKRVFLEAKK